MKPGAYTPEEISEGRYGQPWKEGDRIPMAELCAVGEAERPALTPEIARQLAESGVASLKPGDILAVRVPFPTRADHMRHLLDYADKVEADTGVKVAFIPGEEFAHVTVNVTVNMAAATPEALAGEIRREITEQVRTAARHVHRFPEPETDDDGNPVEGDAGPPEYVPFTVERDAG